MSKRLAPKPEEKDLQQLRDILFGEQALQTEDRFAALESAINTLRRETRQLRQALEIEAIARLEADNTQGESFAQELDTSLSDLVTILVNHLENDKQKRTAQYTTLAQTLDAYRQSQDDVSEELVAHLRSEQRKRQEQFSQLLAALSTGQANQDEVSMAVSALLRQYRAKRQNEDAPEAADPAVINGKSSSSQTAKPSA
jgi:vacuolar-type H+-ATPase subunit I/STV1